MRPPLRPVCSVFNAYESNKLDHLISLYLANVWKNEGENYASTGELLVEFVRLNEECVE